MKQRISVEQLQELSEEQKDRLREWWKPARGDCYCDIYDAEVFIGEATPGYTDDEYSPGAGALPLLSIGQCLEFLQGHNELQIRKWGDWMVYSHETGETKKPELIDALWSAVKSVL